MNKKRKASNKKSLVKKRRKGTIIDFKNNYENEQESDDSFGIDPLRSDEEEEIKDEPLDFPEFDEDDGRVQLYSLLSK